MSHTRKDMRANQDTRQPRHDGRERNRLFRDRLEKDAAVAAGITSAKSQTDFATRYGDSPRDEEISR